MFISQQTLSNHLARLERYYGTKLLVHGTEPSLTPAGRLVLDHAKRVCESDQNALRMIAELNGRANLKLLERVPVCMMDNRVADYVRRVYQSAGAQPNTVVTASNFRIGFEKCLAGGPATFTTTTSLIADMQDRPDDLLILPVYLADEQLALQLSLSCLPSRHQAQFTKELMNLIGEYYLSIEQFC
ncbi:LysR family transcriptional regulator [Enorma phocaeensis]|uniref:LysR family transcriptional regulator n=1 Tax=Enorma phocaeensis TaxID=1871019 RepID=UPI00320AAF8C